jgi:hypothetical protein
MARGQSRECVRQILTVQKLNAAARAGEEGPRKAAIIILLQQLVIADDANAVAGAGIRARSNGRCHTPLCFFAERLGIIAHVLVEFAEDTRRVPQLANRHAFCEVAITLAVIPIGMGQRKA